MGIESKTGAMLPFTCLLVIFLSSSHGYSWRELSDCLHISRESPFYLNPLSLKEIGSFCSLEDSSEPVALARSKAWPQVTGDRAGIGSWTNSGPWPLAMVIC